MKRDDLTTDERLLYMPMWEHVAMGATVDASNSSRMMEQLETILQKVAA